MNSSSGTILVFGIILGLPFIIVLVAVPFALWFNQQRRSEHITVANKGAMTLQSCPLCGGQVEAGEILTQGRWLHFKGSQSSYPIGAVRCRKCGHLELFT